MCDTCPKAKQMQDPLEFGLMEQLMGMAMQPGTPMTQGPICEHCGYTEAQFKKTGRLGCPECYRVFIMPKMDILNRIHGSIIHKGKVPKSTGDKAIRKKVQDLKEKLKKLIEDEAYEEAARVRDEIKFMTEGSPAPKKRKPRAAATKKKK